MTVATGREQSNRDNKKLTKVLSTKLSIDDYNPFCNILEDGTCTRNNR
jgi:hypothetical protein